MKSRMVKHHIFLIIVFSILFFALNAHAQSLPAATHIDSIEGGKLVKIITIYPIKVFPLEKKKGEDLLGTQNMLVNVDAELWTAESNIDIRVTVVVSEEGGAGSTYSKTVKKEALIVGLENPDYDIVGFESGSGKVNATIPYEQTGTSSLGGNGIIKSTECTANVKGPAVGRLGCDIQFNPVRLVMEKKK